MNTHTPIVILIGLLLFSSSVKSQSYATSQPATGCIAYSKNITPAIKTSAIVLAQAKLAKSRSLSIAGNESLVGNQLNSIITETSQAEIQPFIIISEEEKHINGEAMWCATITERPT